MSELDIKVSEATGNPELTCITLSGFLDAYTYQKFEEELKKQIQQNKFKIIVDMENLDYISSAGLGVFMSVIAQIRQHNGDIKLTGLNSKVYKVFDLLGFTKLFQIFSEFDEAMNAF